MSPAPVAPRAPKPSEIKALKAALVREDGRLPDGLSTRLLTSMYDAGYICREDTADVRVDDQGAVVGDPAAWRITAVGRRAVLTDAQWRVLTERVGEDDALLPGVTWVTKQALHDLGLVEYRDGDGSIQPTDGSTGLRGPIYRAFRTEAGRHLAVADLTSE